MVHDAVELLVLLLCTGLDEELIEDFQEGPAAVDHFGDDIGAISLDREVDLLIHF